MGKVETSHWDVDGPIGDGSLAQRLGLENLGLAIHRLDAGEGFDFFHNHREQEEIYVCIEGRISLLVKPDGPESETQTITLVRGDIARVPPELLRALGNQSSETSIVLIAGACKHPYPSNAGDHEVIADVRTIVGRGTTGFKTPTRLNKKDVEDFEDANC